MNKNTNINFELNIFDIFYKSIAQQLRIKKKLIEYLKSKASNFSIEMFFLKSFLYHSLNKDFKTEKIEKKFFLIFDRVIDRMKYRNFHDFYISK